MPQISRLSNDEIGPAFREFCAVQYQAGVRIICVEGLMGAGKSFLLQFAPKIFTTVELDKYLPKPALCNAPWIEQVISSGAVQVIETSLLEGLYLIVEGVVAWPVVGPSATKTNVKTARVYVKGLSTLGGEPYWNEGEALERTDKSRAPYFESMREYHSNKQPWFQADLILERLEGRRL